MAVEHPITDLCEDLLSSPSPAPQCSERVAKGKKALPLDTCDEELSRMGDPKTLGTIRALAVDGA